MNYVPKSYQYFWLTIWEEYKGDQWQWEFKISVEFFTSSPCLLLHDSKVDWLKSKLS